ncbi:MAG: alanine--tRNA ligase [Candidatus Moraniibacteriota bacterium]
MHTNDIRQKYLEFFKDRGHIIVPSAPLVPENDPTTLFTGSGMQPIVPYLLGEPHPMGTRITDSQKCFRSQDIEEVGDNRHTTFFEMLGNWSFGDYFKQEQIEWMWEFLTDEIGIDPNKLYISCFIGDSRYGIPQDTEAAEKWQKLFECKGIEARIAEIGTEEQGYVRGMEPGERIFYYDGKKNWWNRGKTGPETTAIGDPCGPDSEMFYDFGGTHDKKWGEECHPNCDCGRFLEIGNNVFMAYRKVSENLFEPLVKPNVDFGGGLERMAAAVVNDPDVFKTDAFSRALKVLEVARSVDYTTTQWPIKYSMRVILDHVRASVFLIADGVLPSNKDQGYFVRRLIRRVVRYAKKLGMREVYLEKTADAFIATYQQAYPILLERRDYILSTLLSEEKKFLTGLEKGLKEFEKMYQVGQISGEDAFLLFSTYGFPLEMTEELVLEQGGKLNREAFQAEFKKHQDLSRTASVGKFKGGLADNSDKVTAYHTATHLMLAGLRQELGNDVHQAGSNITEERTRFDFTYPEKVSRETLDRVEAYVNTAIESGATITTAVMEKEAARAAGVEGSFWEKYPEKVTVYQVKGSDGTIYSQELCGGPHVVNTTDISAFGRFKIVKEEASSAGVRRVKAILE